MLSNGVIRLRSGRDPHEDIYFKINVGIPRTDLLPETLNRMPADFLACQMQSGKCCFWAPLSPAFQVGKLLCEIAQSLMLQCLLCSQGTIIDTGASDTVLSHTVVRRFEMLDRVEPTCSQRLCHVYISTVPFSTQLALGRNQPGRRLLFQTRSSPG